MSFYKDGSFCRYSTRTLSFLTAFISNDHHEVLEASDLMQDCISNIICNSLVLDSGYLKALISAYFICSRQFGTRVNLFKEISRAIHSTVGNHSDDVAPPIVETLNFCNIMHSPKKDKLIPAAILGICSCLNTLMDDVEYLTNILKSPKFQGRTDIETRVCLFTKEAVSTLREFLESSIFEQSDCIFKSLEKIFKTCTILLKYVIISINIGNRKDKTRWKFFGTTS
jgi:hypothetical protein